MGKTMIRFSEHESNTHTRPTHHMIMPTPTESILRAVEMSDAEEEATRFIRHIQDLQNMLRDSTAAGFDATHDRLKECHDVAKIRFEFYERMADLWRGAEFNLNVCMRNAASQRERAHEDALNASLVPPTLAPAPAPEPAPAATAPTSMSELILRLTNDAQKQALQRLLARSESNQVYLAGYEANPIRTGVAGYTEGTFTILGTIRHGIRESYTVKWYRLSANKPSFWCNCPDHKFNSGKKNMVCKHICFLVTRVARILDPAFFEGKRLTAEQHAQFLEIVGNAAIFQDPISHTVPTTPHTRAMFMECRKPIEPEDSCPICYDAMETDCLNCPACSNNVHRECMEVWLERNQTCVYCRSTVWSAWNFSA